MKDQNFQWAENCSLRVAFIVGGERISAKFTMTLPVTDNAIAVNVEGRSVEQMFSALPCEDAVIVERLASTSEKYLIPIQRGTNNFEILVSAPPTPASIQLLAGSQPLRGLSLWAMGRGSTQTVTRSAATSVTDEDGLAIVSLPPENSVTVYLQDAHGWAEIERAEFRHDGSPISSRSSGYDCSRCRDERRGSAVTGRPLSWYGRRQSGISPTSSTIGNNPL